MKTSEELKIQRFLKQTLDFLYARTVLELLNEVVKDNCYGCEIDHPSQTQHTCLMWTTTEHLDTYFEQTFNKIKYGDVIIKLREQDSGADGYTQLSQKQCIRTVSGMV